MTHPFQVVAFGLLALAGASCSNEPNDPTWADDIHPLMVARCIRCHDATGEIDPASAATGNMTLKQAATPNFDFVNFGDIPPASLALLKIAANYTRGAVGTIPRMPPSPAAELADWQIDLLDSWGKSPK